MKILAINIKHECANYGHNDNEHNDKEYNDKEHNDNEHNNNNTKNKYTNHGLHNINNSHIRSILSTFLVSFLLFKDNVNALKYEHKNFYNNNISYGRLINFNNI